MKKIFRCLEIMAPALLSLAACAQPVFAASQPSAGHAAWPSPSKDHPMSPAAQVFAQQKAGAGPRAALAAAKLLPAQQKKQPGIVGGSSARPLSVGALGAGSLPFNFPGFQRSSLIVSAVPTGSSVPVESTLSLDVDHDGLLDIVTVQEDGTLNVSLNPGAGKLGSMKVTSTNRSIVGDGGWARYAQTADINGDGYLDVVVFDENNGNIDLFLNKKDGTFANATRQHPTFTSGDELNYEAYGGGVAFGDVTGDGIVDMVAFAMTDGSNPQTGSFVGSFELVTYPGKGDGTFASPLPEQLSLFNGFIDNDLTGQYTLVDMNKDGKLDLVYLCAGEDDNYQSEAFVGVLTGNGDGTFNNLPTQMPTTGAIVPGVHITYSTGGFSVQDVDGDGNLDVLFSDTEDPNIYVTLGSSDGTLGAATAVIGGLGGAGQFFSYPDVVNFADVTGDGKTDIIAYFDGYIGVYSGNGDGTFSTTPLTQVASGIGGTAHPLPADMDGDGKADLVRVDYASGNASIYLGTNSGFPGASLLTPPGESGNNIHVIATGDLNGDGVPDVLAYDWSQNAPNPALVTGVNDGKGNFTYTTLIQPFDFFDFPSNNIEPLLVDFNGDNNADILLTTYEYNDGGFAIMLSDGKGGFGSVTNVPLGTPTACYPSLADAADLNGDGKTDIVLIYAGDSSCFGQGPTPAGYFTLLSNGDGTFKSTFTPLGHELYEPKLIDFNGDGKLDLAISDVDVNRGQYNFWIVPGNGDGTFNVASAVQPAPNRIITAIIPGDFDGDGKQDLTLGQEALTDPSGDFLVGSSGVVMFKGNGDFTFSLPTEYDFGSFPYSGAFADFNGDGNADLVVNLATFEYGAPAPVSAVGYMVGLGGGSFSPLQQTDIGGDGYNNEFQGAFGFGDFYDNGYVFVADFNGDGAPDVLNSLNTDDSVTISSLMLNTGAIQFTLAAGSSSITQDSPVTLTATLTPSVSTRTPSGTISLYDNGTLLEAVPVSGNTTSINLTSLAVGSNAITATYSGDANFNGATAGAAITVAVAPLAPTFTLSAPTPASLSLTQGQTGTVTVSLTGNATFSGPVTFSCSGAPSEATCTVAPGSVTLAGGQTASVAVVVATTVKNNKGAAATLVIPSWLKGAGGLSMAGLVLVLLPGRRRRIQGMWMVLLLLAAGTVATLSLSGCGDDSSKYPGTPVGTSTLTITATSGSITQSQTISLTVN